VYCFTSVTYADSDVLTHLALQRAAEVWEILDSTDYNPNKLNVCGGWDACAPQIHRKWQRDNFQSAATIQLYFLPFQM
jgi:hypothetical protein